MAWGSMVIGMATRSSCEPRLRAEARSAGAQIAYRVVTLCNLRGLAFGLHSETAMPQDGLRGHIVAPSCVHLFGYRPSLHSSDTRNRQILTLRLIHDLLRRR